MLVLTLALTLTSGQISGAPRSAHLIEAQLPGSPPNAVAPGGFDAPLVAAPPEVEVSSAQLQVDLQAIKRLRPSIGAGIGLLIGGTVAAAAGALYLGLGVGLSAASGIVVLAYLGGGIMAIGLPLAVVGVWLLITRSAEREPIDKEIIRLNTELQRQLRREQQRRREFAAPGRADTSSSGVPLAAF